MTPLSCHFSVYLCMKAIIKFDHSIHSGGSSNAKYNNGKPMECRRCPYCLYCSHIKESPSSAYCGTIENGPRTFTHSIWFNGLFEVKLKKESKNSMPIVAAFSFPCVSIVISSFYLLLAQFRGMSKRDYLNMKTR